MEAFCSLIQTFNTLKQLQKPLIKLLEGSLNIQFLSDSQSVVVKCQVTLMHECELAEADDYRAKARGDLTVQLFAAAECYHTQSYLFNTLVRNPRC